MRRDIVFTGGGTSGHVTPNLALIKVLSEQGWQCRYIGSYSGIEKQLVEREGIEYKAISSGKLRRYFSWENFIDPFKVLAGTVQAWWDLRRRKPHMVFSKGGFVALPVVVAAWLLRIPVLAHESDLTPGLTTRLSYPFVDKLCLTFAPQGQPFKDMSRVTVTGTPVRTSLLAGDKQRAREFTQLPGELPTLLIFGGGLGAQSINTLITENVAALCAQYQVIHICGADKVVDVKHENYRAYPYLHEEFADCMALADVVIARAGANSVYELLRLHKPHILIPLPADRSRGDQIANAKYLAERQLSEVIPEAELSAESLLATIQRVLADADTIKARLQAAQFPDATAAIVAELEQVITVMSAA